MSGGPNYAALMELLAKFGRVVDTCGYVTLNSEQAMVLRALGFSDATGAGRWKVPIPPATPEAQPAIRDPRSETPCEQDRKTDATPQPPNETAAGSYREQRQAKRLTIPPSREPIRDREVEQVSEKIMAILGREGGQITKRRQQQRLWRYSASTFKEALRSPDRHRSIFLESKQLNLRHLCVTQAATQLCPGCSEWPPRNGFAGRVLRGEPAPHRKPPFTR